VGLTVELTPLLSEFVTRAEAVATQFPALVAQEASYLAHHTSAAACMVPHNSVLCETPHAYFPDSKEEQMVHIPGAECLTIEFDPRYGACSEPMGSKRCSSV
jgi:hypothetical protein